MKANCSRNQPWFGSSSILRNGSLAIRHESGVIERTPIQSICAFTNAGTSSGRVRTAVRLITR